MINVIFKEPQKEITRRTLEEYYRFNKLLVWARLHPDRFIEEFFGATLYDHQRYMLLGTWTATNAAWIASRRAGKSLCSGLYLPTRAILLPKQRIYIVSGEKNSQSEETFANIERIALKQVPTFHGLTDILLGEVDGGKAGFTHEKGNHKVTFWNGSTIETLTSNVAANRGLTANVLFFDEAGFMDDEMYNTVVPLIAMDADAGIAGGNWNKEIMPKKFPNQLILASSASHVHTKFFSYAKTWTTQMMFGNSNFFVCDITADITTAPSHRTEPQTPLVSPAVVENEMAANEYAGQREYYNRFDDGGGTDSITSQQKIRDCEELYLPYTRYCNDDLPECYIPIRRGDPARRKYIVSYDPSTKIDNSVIAIFELLKHVDRGLILRLVYMQNLAKSSATGEKIVLTKPDQYKRIRSLIVAFNNSPSADDYVNIEKFLIDEGAGGGGYTDMVGGFVNKFKDHLNRDRAGMIMRDHPRLKKDTEFMMEHADAKDIIHLINYRAEKSAMYESLSEAINDGLLIFPATDYNQRGFVKKEVQNENGDYVVKQLRPSEEEKRALDEIGMAKVEMCQMQRFRSGMSITYDFPPDKRNKYHDDRCDTVAQATWWLRKLRVLDNYKGTEQTSFKDAVAAMPQGKRNPSPFSGNRPAEWGKGGAMPWQ